MALSQMTLLFGNEQELLICPVWSVLDLITLAFIVLIKCPNLKQSQPDIRNYGWFVS